MAEDECRDHYIELLENYKSYRCLWDTSHPLYSNRDNRNRAYKGLLKVYKKIKADANLGDLKRKIDNMRTTFNRELRKVKETITNGAGTCKKYFPKLWYYEYLMFLTEKEACELEEPVEKDAKDFNSQDSEYEIQQEQTRASHVNIKYVASPSTPDCTLPPPHKKIRSSTNEKTQEQLIDLASALINSNQQDEWELMGLSFGMQLRQLDPEQQAISQKLMSDVLYYGKMKKLTHYSSVQLSPNPQPSHIYPQPSSITSSSHCQNSPPRSSVQNQETT